MNRFQLFRLLRRHNRLSFRRNPAYDQSVVAKVLMVFGAGLTIIYMIFAGTLFGGIANDSGSPTFIMFLLPAFLLEVDFLSRFMVQKTPSMLVKPYMLQPLPRRTVVETFLLTSLAAGYNWMWLTLFLPYAFIIYCGGAELGVVMMVVVCCMLLILANSQFYLLVRTLVARSLLWWLVPIVVYGSFIASLFLAADDNEFIEDILDSYIDAAATPWCLLVCIVILVCLLLVNRSMQSRFAFEEIARESKKAAALKNVSQFTFLERFGQTGEYLKLELKSIMRNKAIRARVIMSLGLIVVLTLLIAYTDIYDGRMMLNFWCFYCFSIYGMTALIKVMGPEGNYIDFLMIHRENILQLLRAKYYFHVAILMVPLLLMLPAIIAGKFPLLMVAAYMLLSSGYLYFLLFQMAVYNKQTLPLEAKVTGKNSVENGLQLAVELLAMLSPLAIVAMLILLFSEQTAYWVLLIVGLAFTLSHPYWLRNIYHRMMLRKYENLEGFHASR